MIVFGTGHSGRPRERHFSTLPRPLAIVEPEIITGPRVTIRVAVNSSRVTGYRAEIAASPAGVAIRSSGDQPLAAGETEFGWYFDDFSRAIETIWARVTYWSDPARPHVALKAVKVIPDVAPIVLGLTWPLAADGLRWDDRLIWPIEVTQPTVPPVPPPTTEVPTIPPIVTAKTRWYGTQVWDDTQVWRDAQ